MRAAVVRCEHAQQSFGGAADRPFVLPGGQPGGRLRIDIQGADPYFAALRSGYGQGLLELFERLPNPGWIASGGPA